MFSDFEVHIGCRVLIENREDTNEWMNDQFIHILSHAMKKTNYFLTIPQNSSEVRYKNSKNICIKSIEDSEWMWVWMECMPFDGKCKPIQLTIHIQFWHFSIFRLKRIHSSLKEQFLCFK